MLTTGTLILPTSPLFPLLLFVQVFLPPSLLSCPPYRALANRLATSASLSRSPLSSSCPFCFCLSLSLLSLLSLFSLFSPLSLSSLLSHLLTYSYRLVQVKPARKLWESKYQDADGEGKGQRLVHQTIIVGSILPIFNKLVSSLQGDKYVYKERGAGEDKEGEGEGEGEDRRMKSEKCWWVRRNSTADLGYHQSELICYFFIFFFFFLLKCRIQIVRAKCGAKRLVGVHVHQDHMNGLLANLSVLEIQVRAQMKRKELLDYMAQHGMNLSFYFLFIYISLYFINIMFYADVKLVNSNELELLPVNSMRAFLEIDKLAYGSRNVRKKRKNNNKIEVSKQLSPPSHLSLPPPSPSPSSFRFYCF